MRVFLPFFALFFVIYAYEVAGVATNEIPAKFLGSWEVEKSENFDEYLEAKGYGWFMRQMVKLAGITKVGYRWVLIYGLGCIVLKK